jgi:hypothetical protein
MNTLEPIAADAVFPKCAADGPSVNPKTFIEPRTGLAVALGSIVLVLFAAVLVLTGAHLSF